MGRARELLNQSRLESLMSRQDSQASASANPVIRYDGWEDGIHYAVTTEGARVPLQALSSGTPQVGQIIAAPLSGQQLLGIWRGHS